MPSTRHTNITVPNGDDARAKRGEASVEHSLIHRARQVMSVALAGATIGTALGGFLPLSVGLASVTEVTGLGLGLIAGVFLVAKQLV